MMPIKICFISLKSYPLFIKNSTEYFGGAEVQISLLAKELAKDKRFSVSVITGNYGQQSIIHQNGLILFKTKLFDFLKILKKADADIYVERTINPKIIPVYLFCRCFRKKMVYMVAHDWDLNHRVIKLADLIITQHRQQKAVLGRNNLVMPSLINTSVSKKTGKRKYILWVGRIDSWKKPLDYLDIARDYPREKFVMICRPGKVKLSTSNLPNLKLITAVPMEKILDYFYQAKILVNTSLAEGFPNTFLQAGITKTPILSYRVNPDNYLNQYHCGLVGQGYFGKIMNRPRQLTIMGQNHYQYVKKNHNLGKINIFKLALLGLLK